MVIYAIANVLNSHPGIAAAVFMCVSLADPSYLCAPQILTFSDASHLRQPLIEESSLLNQLYILSLPQH